MTDEVPWLEELESKVESAVEEIARLREEKRELEEKQAARGEPVASDEGADAAQAWREERREVRERVEGIVERLEDLLEGDA